MAELVYDKTGRLLFTKEMKKEYTIGGMMCNHCRMHVEKALNSVPGVTATVTLDPPVATVETAEGEIPFDALRQAVEAEGYTISEK